MSYRKPIVSVLGHVDHGKTALLDSIRESDVRNYEPGGITQHVEVTNVPSEVIESFVGDRYNVSVPGFVMIDTPGHGAFTVSRRKGGEFADIAVLVIDITNGVQPQTEESLEILRENQTPFVVALNKVDKLPGWNGSVEDSTDRFRSELQQRAYELTADLHEYGFTADLFDNIDDFSSTIAMVPVSAEKRFGIGTLSSVIVGLTQEFMSDNLEVSDDDDVRGIVLDVTSRQGYGKVGDLLLYEGQLETGDEVYVSDGVDSWETTVRSILVPEDMSDSRHTSDYFNSVDSATAATFARLVLSDTERLDAGCLVSDSVVEGDTSETEIEYDDSGVVVCADTTGSLAAVVGEVREEYAVGGGGVGDISKYNVTKAATMPKSYNQVVLGFNVQPTDSALEFAEEEGVEIITENVIHSLIDAYEEYYEQERLDESKAYESLELPARFTVMEDFVFNKSNPAIVGVRVTEGVLREGSRLVTSIEEYEDASIGTVERIEKDGGKVDELKQGEEGSISVSGATVGRDFDEGDELIVQISETTARYIDKRFEDEVPPSVAKLTEEIKEHQQEWNPFWGV